MMRKKRVYPFPIVWRSVALLASAVWLLLAGSCSDELASDSASDGEFPAAGSEVAFAVVSPAKSAYITRAITDGKLPSGYEPMTRQGELTITMTHEGATTSSRYNVANGACTVATGESPLRWQDNQKLHSFTAQCGEETLASEQTAENWEAQDLLKGYAAVPTGSEGNYTLPTVAESKTNKEWYTAIKTWLGEGADTKEYQTIPLFMTHQRAWITVILKAGEGVKREDLNPSTASQIISARILSYTGEAESKAKQEITPRQGSAKVNYDKDVNGDAETDRETVTYEAIVEPHDYSASPDDDKIFAVSLSGQNFSFYASNDALYAQKDENGNEAKWKESYNLTAGKHLTITATLSRESRKVLMTAYIEEWDEEENTFICDDFGGAGNPVVISSRETLLAFLQNPEQNKAGNVAIVGVTTLDLTKTESGTTAEDWNPKGLELKSTLNIGGSTIILPGRLLDKVTSTGSIISGRIELTKSVDAALCKENEGTLRKLELVPQTDGVKATRAGLAITNHSIISSCISYLPVAYDGDGNSVTEKTYIGGIAAESCSTEQYKATIEDCTVYSCVDIPDGTQNVYGAGIVGLASGTMSNNTYEFGVTMSQSGRQCGDELLLRNIVHTKQHEDLTASGNRWPTTVTYDWLGDNLYSPTYDAVISSQEELKKLVDANNSADNAYGKSYRIACDFEVNTDTYGTAVKNDELTATAAYNVLFTLEGNSKCLTLTEGKYNYSYTIKDGQSSTTYSGTQITAPMLFGNITGVVQNLNIHLKNSINGIPDGYSTDVAAPLAYSVAKGQDREEAGQLINVHVTAESGAEVSAAGPSGLVVWGYNGAKLTSCSSNVKVSLSVSQLNTGGEKRYAGGLLSQADNVTLDRCHFDNKVVCTDNEKNTFYLGGLVGSVDVKMVSSQPIENDAVPNLTLTDCYSLFQPSTSNGCTVGAVLGRSYYLATGTSEQKTHGVVSSACQGNWWYEATGTQAVGARTNTDGYTTDEKILGKRNSVQPF